MVNFTQSEAAKDFRGEILNIKGDDRCASHGRASHLALVLQMAAATGFWESTSLTV